ncbi:hypothetical protein D3C71_1485080 [compost metagenome]
MAPSEAPAFTTNSFSLPAAIQTPLPDPDPPCTFPLTTTPTGSTQAAPSLCAKMPADPAPVACKVPDCWTATGLPVPFCPVAPANPPCGPPASPPPPPTDCATMPCALAPLVIRTPSKATLTVPPAPPSEPDTDCLLNPCGLN